MLDEIAGVRIPDSAIAVEAVRLAKELSSETLYNHVMRTYVFGSLLGKKRGWKVDEELLFLGSVLHDLGLTEHHHGPQRFEVEGADAAHRFLLGHDYPEERADVVWDAIALHTLVGIADRKQPEIALVHLGAGVDVIGLGLDAFSPDIVDRVLDLLPRRDFKRGLVEALISTVKTHPSSAMHTFTLELARNEVAGFCCPTFVQMVSAAPFAE